MGLSVIPDHSFRPVFYRNHFAKIAVYFSELNYEEIDEQEAYQVRTLSSLTEILLGCY